MHSGWLFLVFGGIGTGVGLATLLGPSLGRRWERRRNSKDLIDGVPARPGIGPVEALGNRMLTVESDVRSIKSTQAIHGEILDYLRETLTPNGGSSWRDQVNKGLGIKEPGPRSQK